MSGAAVIEAVGLTKRYGRSIAVDGVDLSVAAGQVFGILGPNGSGKTTTILMLLGLTEPTSGQARVLGYDPLRQPLQVKRRVGYLPDSVGFYDHLTARENLAFTARLGDIPDPEAAVRIEAALSRVGLSEVADRRTRTFSHGMKQRLGLAEILVKKADVAILDEPTNGLDPQATHELLALIRRFSSEGMTILLSSHQLGLVESICDEVALFRNGRVGIAGSVRALADRVLGGEFIVEVEAKGLDVASAVGGIGGVSGVVATGTDTWRIEAGRDVRAEVASRIVAGGGALQTLAIRKAGLDEVYVRYFAPESGQKHSESGQKELAHAA